MNTSHTFFDWLLETSWQASLLALLVIAVQRIFRNTLPARWRYLLWLLVVARLLIPALPESPALDQPGLQPPLGAVPQDPCPRYAAADDQNI